MTTWQVITGWNQVEYAHVRYFNDNVPINVKPHLPQVSGDLQKLHDKFPTPGDRNFELHILISFTPIIWLFLLQMHLYPEDNFGWRIIQIPTCCLM